MALVAERPDEYLVPAFVRHLLTAVEVGVERHAQPTGNDAVTVRCHHALVGEVLGHPAQQGFPNRIVRYEGGPCFSDLVDTGKQPRTVGKRSDHDAVYLCHGGDPAMERPFWPEVLPRAPVAARQG